MYQWKKLARQLCETGDALWLISHASYLVKTAGCLWAVDPRLDSAMHNMADPTVAEDLSSLRLALITHLHTDHFDLPLIQKLSRNDTLWVFPAFVPQALKEELTALLRRCVFLEAGQELAAGEITVRAFASAHEDVFAGQRFGVPELGYAVQAGGRRFLFPGDVRRYAADVLPPEIGGEVFAHVWLGRQQALYPAREMVERFCSFYLAMQPDRLWLTHLYDWEREAKDMWTAEHGKLLRTSIQKETPVLDVRIPEHGKRYEL